MRKNPLLTLFSSPVRICWTLLLLMTAVFFFRPVETGDIWWHLKAGEYIYTHKVVPLLDPFPTSGEKTLWVLTQWLGSLVYYLAFHAAGPLGLKVLRVLIILLSLWQLRRFGGQRDVAPLLPFLGFLLLMAVATRPHLRPFLFNLLFIQVMLGALLTFHKTARAVALWPVVLIAPLWVNIHMGSFVYGFTLIGVFLMTAAVEAYTQGRSWRRVGWLGGLTGLYALAFLVNPYGIQGALHPLRTLFVPDYLNFELIKAAISELQPPRLMTGAYLWFWPTLILGGAAVYWDRAGRFRNTILLACGLFMFLYGQRAALFFALICLYLFIEACGPELVRRITAKKRVLWGTHAILYLLIIFVTAGYFQQKVFWNGRIERCVAMSEAYTSPGPILDDLAWEKTSGIVFNDDAYGGYILWHYYPQLRPFADTRQINITNFQLFNLILNDPHRYWNYSDLQQRIAVVLLDADKVVNWKLIRYLQSRDDWHLSAVQGSQLLFRRGKKEDGLLAYKRELRAHDSQLEDFRRELEALVQAGPRHKVRYVHMEPADSAMTLFELGYRGAALERLLYSFRISNSPYQHAIARLILKNL